MSDNGDYDTGGSSLGSNTSGDGTNTWKRDSSTNNSLRSTSEARSWDDLRSGNNRDEWTNEVQSYNPICYVVDDDTTSLNQNRSSTPSSVLRAPKRDNWNDDPPTNPSYFLDDDTSLNFYRDPTPITIPIPSPSRSRTRTPTSIRYSHSRTPTPLPCPTPAPSPIRAAEEGKARPVSPLLVYEDEGDHFVLSILAMVVVIILVVFLLMQWV